MKAKQAQNRFCQKFFYRLGPNPWALAEKNAGGGKNILEMAILLKAIVRKVSVIG